MNDKVTIEDIVSFIRYYLDDYKTIIEPKTSLQHDLRIYGYDAEDFLSEFSKKFNVDLSDFEVKKHFLGEGGVWKPWLWGKLNTKDESEKRPFTIQDLYNLSNRIK